MIEYCCPRFEDWPNLDLYMDQVISLLEEKTKLFYQENETKFVTSTMINNYVKQKIVIPSQNKKYKREHLAYLYTIFLLKSALNLTDVCAVISFLEKSESVEEGYNLFCSEIESAISTAFSEKTQTAKTGSKDIPVLHTIALAFAYTHLARFYIANEDAD